MALLQCPECGNTISDRATSCPKCGLPLQQQAPQIPQYPYAPAPGYVQPVYNAAPPRPALTPEQEEWLDKFHWGPFTFSWIWALCNGLLIHALITLVACIFLGVLGLVAGFAFGFKGNRWAWEKSKASTFEEYVSKQESWDRWGRGAFVIAFIVSIFFFFVYLDIILNILK